jgi:hypothetical protein
LPGSTSTCGDSVLTARRHALLADVKAFEHASVAGDFYESFEVDSKNFMEQSRGTTHWIAEFRRLLGRCVTQGQKGNAAETCPAFGILFGLLDRLDEGRDDIVFFADEEAPGWSASIGRPCSRRGSKSCQRRHRPMSTRAESLDPTLGREIRKTRRGRVA